MTLNLLYSVPKALLSYVPSALNPARLRSKQCDDLRYGYSIWMRHLVMRAKVGIRTVPRGIVEIGPGLSLGAGLTALLCGTHRYVAIDTDRSVDLRRAVAMLDELVCLLRRRAEIPGEQEYTRLKPKLESYAFPEDLLPPEHLDECLRSDRVDSIRKHLLDPGAPDDAAAPLAYLAPCDDPSRIGEGWAEMVFSQAVMQEVEDLDAMYSAIYRALAPGGYAAHQIDYKVQQTTREWNGHWTCSDRTWRMLRGRLPSWHNRHPHSTHIAALRQVGFDIRAETTVRRASEIARDTLAPRFRHMTDEDLVTSGAFIQVIKPDS